MTSKERSKNIFSGGFVSDEKSPTLKSLDAHGDVHFPFLIWKVGQTYINPSDEFVELVYTFPTSHGSTLQNISVNMNGNHLVGLVVPNDVGDDNYSDALADGNSAILIEKNSFGLFTMNVGNLGPGESCSIQFESASVLDTFDNQSRIVFPTVIGERYGDAISQGGLGVHTTTDNNWLVEYPFNLSVTLHGQASKFAISSSTHKIKITQESNVVVTLDEDAYLDSDFELTLENITLAPNGCVFKDAFSDTEQYIALSRFVWDASDSIGSEASASPLKILIDCSGSMKGERIRQAKSAVHNILATFNVDQRFTLSKFGIHTSHFCWKPMKAGPASLKSAFNWIEDLNADMGGTELINAVQEVSNLGKAGSTDLLLITDGEIWDGHQFVKTLLDLGIRLFVVAIGNSNNSNLLIHAAKVTGGHAEIPYTDAHIEQASFRLYKRTRSARAVFSNIAVGGQECTWHDDVPPIYKNQAVDIFSVQPNFHSNSTIEIDISKGQGVSKVELTSILEKIEDEFLAQTLTRICMSRAIVNLERVQLSRSLTSQQSEIIPPFEQEADLKEIGTRYQLLSNQTKYLLVHDRSTKAGELPVHIPMKQMEARVDNFIDAREVKSKDRLAGSPLLFRQRETPTKFKDLYSKYLYANNRTSKFEIIVAKLKFDPSLRLAFDEHVWERQDLVDEDIIMYSPTLDNARNQGIPEVLINWMLKQADQHTSESDITRSLFILINIKLKYKTLIHTQFSKGSFLRKFAQVLGYIY